MLSQQSTKTTPICTSPRRYPSLLALRMPRSLALGAAILALGAAAMTVNSAAATATPVTFKVTESTVDDLKAVYATVRSTDKIHARSRVSGTVASLSVDEGSQVKTGQVIAIIADQKIALRLAAIDAKLVALKSRVETAKADLERTAKLKKRGIVSQARYDTAKTAFDVASNDLKSARADRSVIEKQGEEGKVLSPADGRVLLVPVTKGSVILPGETIATIAANQYVLRLELPERHAKFLAKGDKVIVGARGLKDAKSKTVTEGTIVQVFPELQNGRVIANAMVPSLGTYFVGERTLVWISAGKRNTMIIPAAYTFHRYGLDYVRLNREGKPPLDIVVQLGRAAKLENDAKTKDGVEVLTGLRTGDQLVKP